ncbi:Protein of unknown function [Pyronema omphalodes CBS 100304]|uniref:Uncharacterized protein n=1 Tax=Pyronema omphalodes (strain CBS 100304) TaxID=1076935 RepID=U4KUB4_PYROM|nr:Protein of unknown function [Pyronema omphalodes CBS 100304]
MNASSISNFPRDYDFDFTSSKRTG